MIEDRNIKQITLGAMQEHLGYTGKYSMDIVLGAAKGKD